jgi:hypothetical protein
VGEAGLDDGALVPQALFGTAQPQRERGQIWAAEIGQFDPFEVVSDALVGVEVRRVGGQLLQMQPLGGSAAQELFDCLAAMDGEPSQMRMILPRGLRSSTRRKPTTATLS